MQHSSAIVFAAILSILIAPVGCGSESSVPVSADEAPDGADPDVPVDAHLRGGTPLEIPIYTTPVEAAPPPGEELPITVVRTFDCVPEGVGAELVVGPVTGEPGAVVLVRPADAGACRFDLVYRAADGAEQVLSEGGGGYLFAAAVRAPSGVAVVCVNDIVHRADGGLQRYVEGVHVACAASTGGAFGPLAPVVVPDGAWAAWLRSLGVSDGPPGAFVLRYTRDFSFHFFNLSDNGRPASDGVYEVSLSVDGAGALRRSPGPDAKVGARTNPLAAAAVEEWRPEATEKQALEGVIDFSDGPCAKGCP